jgi:hypothetical protein
VWKKIAFGIIVVLLVVGTLMFGLDRYGRSQHAALARYISQLKANGEKLTFADLAIPPSTNEAEAASRAVFTNTAFEDPDIRCLMMQYSSAGMARVAWRGRLLIESTNEDESFAVGNWDELSAENRRVAQKLDVFREALHVPTPDNGWIYDNTFTNLMAAHPSTPRLARHVGRALANAVIEDLHNTNMIEALTNLYAMASLANLCRNNLEFLNILVRSANAKAGLDATWEALQVPGWGEPELSKLQESWTSLDLLNGLERSILAERGRMLVSMEAIWNWKLSEMVSAFTMNETLSNGTLIQPSLKERLPLYLACVNYRSRWLDDDERRQLEYWTALADAVRRIENGKPAAETASLIDAAYKRTDNDYRQMSTLHRMIAVSFIPFKPTSSVQRVLEVEAQRKLTITAIAIMRYQLKHGAAPKELGSLAPEFLASVPMDPMSGKPLCYRLNADGSFTLYSTGEDGKDDGGDGTPSDGSQKFGLWEGRDAVWPTADVGMR